MTPDLMQLTRRVEQLERIERENEGLRTEMRRERRRSRIQMALAFVTVVGALLVSPANRTAMAQAGNNLFSRVAELERKTQFFDVQTDAVTSTEDLYIVGTNVHVVNALTPANINGLGNLIIGGNRSRAFAGGTDERTGSHNLVIGDRNNYIGQEGVVIGDFNSIEDSGSSVFGGGGNTAARGSVVYGGSGNSADFTSYIFGGQRNLTQHGGVVLGGADNRALSFEGNVVVGGQRNSAGGSFITVVGGADNRPLFGTLTHRTVIGGQ